MEHDKIRLVYASAEDMISTFKQGKEQLQNTRAAMDSIAGTLEGGALLGNGGDAYVEAIRNQLYRSMTQLIEDFDEMADDVQEAIKFMQEADAKSQGFFA